MSKWKLISTAPKDREIVVRNPMTGVYRTRFENGEWPLRKWGNLSGVWYPRPTHWLPDPPKGTGHE